MLKYIKGNLFLTTAKVIAHGCNCRGAFNAGIAKQIRHLFPPAYLAYVQKFQQEGWHLGDVQFVYLHPTDKIIANCATQNGYGYRGNQTVYLDYDALASVFRTLIKYSEDNLVAVAMPQIGAGLAGGDWNIINRILQESINGHDKANIEVYSL